MSAHVDSNIEYIQIIKSEFEERKTKNPAYSLRAFAKNLSIDPSSLSSILANKRALPLSKADSFIVKLKLDADKSQAFMRSLLSHVTKKTHNIVLEKAHTIEGEDYFDIISEWEYFAVLSLTNLADFEPSASWISNRLGISLERGSEVFNRLVTLNLLEHDGTRYRPVYSNIKTSEDVASTALKKAHLEEMDLIKDKIINETVDRRHISSLTISVKKESFEKAKTLIRNFRKEMEACLETENDAEEVYQLAIQYYPLTK